MRPERVTNQTTRLRTGMNLWGSGRSLNRVSAHFAPKIPMLGPRRVFSMGVIRQRPNQTRQPIVVNRDLKDASRRDLSGCLG